MYIRTQRTTVKSNGQSMMSDRCSSCEKSGEELKRCSGCKIVHYCSRSCQRTDWPSHKYTCKLLQAENAKGATRRQAGDTCIVFDNTTGAVRPVNKDNLCDKITAMTKVPRPRPKELSGLVVKLQSSLPHPKFFPLTKGGNFTFITDLRWVEPEFEVDVFDLRDLDNTVLVAKIVQMEVWAVRHGIRIMGEGNNQPAIAHFYLRDDNPFPFFHWDDVRPGNHFCLQAPVLHSFADGQVGFRIDNAWQVRILSASGELIIHPSDM